jgi:hypothetical protein
MNNKIVALPELVTVTPGDFLYIVDVTDSTDSPTGTSKKIQQQTQVVLLLD